MQNKFLLTGALLLLLTACGGSGGGGGAGGTPPPVPSEAIELIYSAVEKNWEEVSLNCQCTGDKKNIILGALTYQATAKVMDKQSVELNISDLNVLYNKIKGL